MAAKSDSPISLDVSQYPTGISMGCNIEITYWGKQLQGNLRWIGYKKDPSKVIVGVETVSTIITGYVSYHFDTSANTLTAFKHAYDCRTVTQMELRTEDLVNINCSSVLLDGDYLQILITANIKYI